METYRPHIDRSDRTDAGLEAAIAQGFEATMEHLQRPISREGLAPELANIRKQGATSPENIDTEAIYRKKEANAISGYFMEPIWANTKKWMADHPGEIGTYRRSEKGRRVFTAKPLAQSQQALANDPQNLLIDLYQSSLDTLKRHVAQFVRRQTRTLKHLENSQTPHEQWSRDARTFARYVTILDRGSQTQDFRSDPANLLRLGFMAGEAVSWGIIEGIPRLYQERFGAQIPREELERNLEKGRIMALYMASMHLDVFRVVVNEIFQFREGKDMESTLLPLFNNNVKFDPNGRFPFEINKESLERIAQHVKALPALEAPRTGCPAIAARDADGNNIVTDLYKSAVALADQYYFPIARKSADNLSRPNTR